MACCARKRTRVKMPFHAGNRPTKGARYVAPVTSDPFFNQTTLLLNGNGTNGAQNNTFVDGSPNNFTITRNGNTTQGTFSPFSNPEGAWSNYFDGTGDYITAPASSAWVFGGDVTFECFINIQADSATDNNGQRSAVLFRNAITGTVNFQFMLNGNTTTTGTGISIFRSNDLSLGGNFTFNKNTWYHVAAVRASNVWNLYVNGTSIATTTFSGSIGSSARTMEIGGSAYSGFANMLVGYISNARMVNGTAVYTSNFTPPATPLTAITNTSLLTCQDNRFRDGSSNNFTITRNGDVRVTPFGPFAPSAEYSPSVNGGSGYFDGTGDWLTTPNNTAFAMGTGNFTYEALVYHEQATAWATVLESRSGNTNDGFFVGYNGTATAFVVRGQDFDFMSVTPPPIRQWNHLVLVRSGTTMSLYFNGSRVSSVTNSTNMTNDRIIVGGNANPMVGYISNVRIVKGTAVYDPTQTTLTVPTSPLTAISNTSLLLNFTNGGIIDATSKTILETVGDTQANTTVFKYGTGSIRFDGTGDYLQGQTSDLYGFGTGDFTLECWVYPLAANYSWLFDFRPVGTSANAALPALYGETGGLIYYVSGANRIVGPTLTLNTWSHVALARSGTSTRLFLNGTQVGSTWTDTTNYGATATFKFGRNENTFYANQYADDIRITKGVARYTTNFTPPDREFAGR
jgi:hypothetical protein